MNVLDHFCRYLAPPNGSLVGNYNDRQAQPAQRRQALLDAWEKFKFIPAFHMVGSVFANNPIPVEENCSHLNSPLYTSSLKLRLRV
jgi:hypothetical protein